MGHPRKYFAHNSVVFATLSLEQGLLLLSNPLSKRTLQSCLARAVHLYPVRICHFFVHANHIHIIFVVINPSDAPRFIGHFKAEFAHRINAQFGWDKRTIWCEGYDSPVILTPLRAMLAIAYMYANAARDCQEDTIDQFPGLTSWKMYQKREHTKFWKFIRRPAFKALTPDMHNLQGYTREAERLQNSTKKTHTFRLEPDAWLNAFGITDPREQAEWNKGIVDRVRTLEERARKKREKEKKRVIGREKLLSQAITFDYKSKRSGKRMWCLSEKRAFRIQFIRFLKDLYQQAKDVYKRWHLGDYSVPYPYGLFPPPQPKLVELLADW